MMRTIKTCLKGAPFYNALSDTSNWMAGWMQYCLRKNQD